MIELKVSQGAKPGHGGVLPAAKVSPEIAEIRGVGARRGLHLAAHFTAHFRRRCEMLALHRRVAAAVRRQAGRLQALRRPPLGVSGDLQGDAGDRDLSRLHRGRRQRGRHRRGAAGIHGSPRHADARGRQLRSQCFDRDRRARPRQDRRLRQDRHRLRHGARLCDRRRLVQFGARLHVLAGLHPVAQLPHRPLSDRRHHQDPSRNRALVVSHKIERVYNFIAPRCRRWRN